MKIVYLFVESLFLIPGSSSAQETSTQANSEAPSGTEAHSGHQLLFDSGIEFGLFLDQAERRKEMWHGNFEKGQVPTELKTRADALNGTFYLLAVAVDGCSDSVNTIPYLANLDTASDNISMRVVGPDAGRHIMEAHKTVDGRASTPTVLILNEHFAEVGVFIERPRELQDWAQGEGKTLASGEFMKSKFAWYDEDLGKQTMSEVLDQIEAYIESSSHEHN